MVLAPPKCHCSQRCHAGSKHGPQITAFCCAPLPLIIPFHGWIQPCTPKPCLGTQHPGSKGGCWAQSPGTTEGFQCDMGANRAWDNPPLPALIPDPFLNIPAWKCSAQAPRGAWRGAENHPLGWFPCGVRRCPLSAHPTAVPSAGAEVAQEAAAAA